MILVNEFLSKNPDPGGRKVTDPLDPDPQYCLKVYAASRGKSCTSCRRSLSSTREYKCLSPFHLAITWENYEAIGNWENKKKQGCIKFLIPPPLNPLYWKSYKRNQKGDMKKEEEKVKIQFSFYFFPIFSNVLPKICIPYCTHYNIADFSRELCEFRYVDKINSTLNCYILEMFEIV